MVQIMLTASVQSKSIIRSFTVYSRRYFKNGVIVSPYEFETGGTVMTSIVIFM